MKAAVNPPFAAQHWDLGSMSYALAHLVEQSPEYKKRTLKLTQSLHENRTAPLILDNGADELGEGFYGARFFDMISEIQPYEVIAPDVLGNLEKTRERTFSFLDDSNNQIPYGTGIMAVLQGGDRDKVLELLREYEEDDRITTIGIPYDLLFETPTDIGLPSFSTGHKSWEHSRRRAAFLFSEDFQATCKKEIHLLGMNTLWEFSLYKKFEEKVPANLRSNDTTAPFAAGLNLSAWKSVEDSGDKNWPALKFEWKPLADQAVKSLHNLILYFDAVGDVEALKRAQALEDSGWTYGRQ